MDYTLIFIFAFIIWFCKKVISMSIQKDRMSKQYDLDLKKYPSEAMLKCKFIKGSDLLMPDDIYQICAHENYLQIIDILDSETYLIIQYSQIIRFKVSQQENLTLKNKILIAPIEYLTISYNNTDRRINLIFQMNNVKDYPYYDIIAEQKSDLIKYVTSHLDK